MHYYIFQGKPLISFKEQTAFESISEETAIQLCNEQGKADFLLFESTYKSPRRFCLSESYLESTEDHSMAYFFRHTHRASAVPHWLSDMIKQGKVSAINSAYTGWTSAIGQEMPKQWRVHIAGLGDVGGTLVSGLRLLGGDLISKVGIFDLDKNKIARWEYEANQIYEDYSNRSYPEITALEAHQIFDCDLFAFCVTVGVPPLEDTGKDVRIAQFEGNARVIAHYAKMARQAGFKGIFAVVSDPVDLLCKAALDASNTNDSGESDQLGLAPEQIRGYGLGVMHARATYHAKRNPQFEQYLVEGRAFGPHGDGLVIADSVTQYNDAVSEILTKKTQNANLDVRATGFKPYIAPAFSSGTLSLLATLSEQWHYSAVYMDGIFLGCRNRLLSSGTEVERHFLPEPLYKRLMATHDKLSAFAKQ